jgi:L-fuconolactonase
VNQCTNHADPFILQVLITFDHMVYLIKEKIGSLKSMWLYIGVVAFTCPACGFADSNEVRDSVQHRIDTHIHLYDTRREGSSTFLDPVIHKKIYFPHFAEQFVDTARNGGVELAVVVEASQRREDNYWLMAHVDTSEALLAFIGNLDPRDPQYAKDVDSLSKSEKFRGIRIRPSKPIDLSDPGIMESFAELARRNLVLELGGNGVDPEDVAAIARRFPHMNIIMNHLAGGSLVGDQIQPADWKARVAVFASEPNVYCKVSALYEGSGKNPAPVNSGYYDVLIDPVVAAFGPGRVLFGSNWPLSDMLGSYEDMIRMLDDYCKRHSNLSPEKLFYENAIKAYGISP